MEILLPLLHHRAITAVSPLWLQAQVAAVAAVVLLKQDLLVAQMAGTEETDLRLPYLVLHQHILVVAEVVLTIPVEMVVLEAVVMADLYQTAPTLLLIQVAAAVVEAVAAPADQREQAVQAAAVLSSSSI